MYAVLKSRASYCCTAPAGWLNVSCYFVPQRVALRIYWQVSVSCERPLLLDLPVSFALSSSISVSLSPSPPLFYGSYTSHEGTPAARGARQVECLYLCSTLASAAQSLGLSLGGSTSLWVYQVHQSLSLSLSLSLGGSSSLKQPCLHSSCHRFPPATPCAMCCTSVRRDCRAAGRMWHGAKTAPVLRLPRLLFVESCCCNTTKSLVAASLPCSTKLQMLVQSYRTVQCSAKLQTMCGCLGVGVQGIRHAAQAIFLGCLSCLSLGLACMLQV